MKQFGILAAAFGGTLAVLLIAFLLIEQMGAAGATSGAPIAEATPFVRSLPPPGTPSASAPRASVPAPSASVGASPAGSPAAKPSRSFMPRPSLAPEKATPSPSAPAPSGKPRPTPVPVAPGTVVEIVLPGTAYVDEEVPSNGTITPTGRGGVVLATTRDLSEPLQVAYNLPMNKIPLGMKVARMDTALCGEAEGDFWETYGPAKADPYEYEVEPPAADGCWHYADGAVTDNAVFAIIRGQTTFEIDKVVYTLTAK